MYTAKGTAALLVPLGSEIYKQTGSWAPVFAIAIALDWVTSLLAFFVLPRWRRSLK
jgi:OFA family oxalate/formate antiporter-like MFS transporter